MTLCVHIVRTTFVMQYSDCTCAGGGQSACCLQLFCFSPAFETELLPFLPDFDVSVRKVDVVEAYEQAGKHACCLPSKECIQQPGSSTPATPAYSSFCKLLNCFSDV